MSCCCPRSPPRAPSLPDRKPARFPASCSFAPPPPSTPDPRSHTPRGGRRPAAPPRSSALAPEGRASPGAAPARRPLPPPGLRASPLTLPRRPGTGLLLGDPTRGPSPPRSPAPESEKARDTGTGVKGPLFGADCGRGAGGGRQEPGLESRPGGGGWEEGPLT